MGARPALVPGYAGHQDAVARRLSDQQVRAWVGEMLVDLADRLDLSGVRERVDALLLRCEFADQHVVHAIEDARFGQADLAEAVEEYDRKLIAAAGACSTAAAGRIADLLEALENAFNERATGIEERLKP